jgi:hypothetical protein
MDYYFDRDSSIWKGNGNSARRAFEFKVVYDTTYEIKLTNAEIELFQRISVIADSLNMRNHWNLKDATGFIKAMDKAN